MVAEQLRYQTRVARLRAARARPRELQIRLRKLAELHVLSVHHLRLLRYLRHHVVPDLLLGKLALHRRHFDRVRRALADAHRAAHAVQRRNRHCKLVFALALAGLDLRKLRLRRRSRGFLRTQREGTDRGVRAHKRALVALDALARVPLGYGNRNTALLIRRSAQLKRAVRVVHKRGDRQRVAVHLVDRVEDAVDHLHRLGIAGVLGLLHLVLRVRPRGRDLDLFIGRRARVDRVVVHVHNVLALLQVAVQRRVLHVLDRFRLRHDLRQREERRLQDRVRTLAHADLLGKVNGVDLVKLNVVLRNVALARCIQVVLQLRHIPLAVDQEHAARLHVAHNREALRNIARHMAGHKVRLVDVVRALDGLVAEAQVAHRHAAGLLRVILEVGLHVLVRVVADDLDAVLVRANRTVAAETPELALDGALCRRRGRGLLGKAHVGHVVHDADGELALHLVLCKFLVDCEDGGGRRVLAAQTVTAADHLDVGLTGVRERGHHVEIKRLAQGAGLLRAVQHRKLLAGLGDRRNQLVRAERTVQAHLHQAHLLALRAQIVDDLLRHVADGAHRDDHAVGVGRAVVVEQLVVGPQLLVDLCHVLFHDLGHRFVVLVAGLAVLEEDVAVLMAAAHGRVLGAQGSGTEGRDRVHVHHVLQVLVIPDLDLLQLVAGAEAVKEVQERHSALDRRQVRHRAQVHDLLHVRLRQHRKARLPTRHHVAVVAENVQRVAGQRSGRHVEHAGQQLARDLVHIRDHQEQSLGRRVGRRQCARVQRAVDSAGRAGLRLHLLHLHRRAENVLPSRRRPLVHIVRHRARRRDRVDRRYLRKRIRYMGGRVIAVHRLVVSLHFVISIYLLFRCWALSFYHESPAL